MRLFKRFALACSRLLGLGLSARSLQRLSLRLICDDARTQHFRHPVLRLRAFLRSMRRLQRRMCIRFGRTLRCEFFFLTLARLLGGSIVERALLFGQTLFIVLVHQQRIHFDGQTRFECFTRLRCCVFRLGVAQYLGTGVAMLFFRAQAGLQLHDSAAFGFSTLRCDARGFRRSGSLRLNGKAFSLLA